MNALFELRMRSKTFQYLLFHFPLRFKTFFLTAHAFCARCMRNEGTTALSHNKDSSLTTTYLISLNTLIQKSMNCLVRHIGSTTSWIILYHRHLYSLTYFRTFPNLSPNTRASLLDISDSLVYLDMIVLSHEMSRQSAIRQHNRQHLHKNGDPLDDLYYSGSVFMGTSRYEAKAGCFQIDMFNDVH